MEKSAKIEKFKAGQFHPAFRYKFFVPDKINRQWTWEDASLSKLLENAALKLGELNSLSRIVPDVNLFIHLHILKESVLSSRIEGTRTNIDEALLDEADVNPERRNDWLEVRNYIDAMNSAIKELSKLPVSTPMLNKAHKILMRNVRGEFKGPGEFRRSQNWIGGASLEDAVFIPPSAELVSSLMSDLENFMHNSRIEIPELVRIAILHYQFETIHPYLDGNGRIGRLMIPLFLVEKNLLDKPLLYISKFFEKNKEIYYENLMNVRTKNDLLRWIKFFLTGIAEVAQQSADVLKGILRLKESIEEDIYKWKKRSGSARTLLNHLFEKPVVTVMDVQKVCGLSAKAAGDLLREFQNKAIITEITGKERNRIFLFRNYVNLFND